MIVEDDGLFVGAHDGIAVVCFDVVAIYIYCVALIRTAAAVMNVYDDKY